MTKNDLRRNFRADRRIFVAGLTGAAREQLERALAEVIAPALGRFMQVSTYAALGDEIDPSWADQYIGISSFPRVAGPELVFHQAARAQLSPGCKSIPEPAAFAPMVHPDVLLVPLVAVTMSGVRLGQGRGYYDRALAALRARGSVLAIGLAWECQIAPALPADAWDVPVDMIATPQRLVDCRKNR